MKYEQPRFLKGINHRFDITTQDDPERLYRLENSRIQKRGETGQVSRIEGFEELSNSPTLDGEVHDTITFQDNIVTLWHDGTNVRIDINNLNEDSQDDESFSFSGVDLGYGKLLLLEDSIYITPYNKQLNYIDGEWYINNFKSSVPILEINQDDLGTKATGSITVTNGTGSSDGQIFFSIGGIFSVFDNLFYFASENDTKLEIANGLANSLGGSFNRYVLDSIDDSGSDPVVNIIAENTGSQWNKSIALISNETFATFEVEHLSGGSFEEGHLTPDENYWYAVRLVYQDGHKTFTSFPQFVRPHPHRAVRLEITTPRDLDENLIDVEIFRKKAGEEFFLIDSLTVTTDTSFEYIDRGKSRLKPLNERNYIWNEEERTSEIVRNRIVRAGLTYKNRDIPIDATIDTVQTSSDRVIIPDIQMSIYGRTRFDDGIRSPHKLLDEIEVETDDQTWRSDLNSLPSDGTEVGYYVGFERQTIVREESIQFSTLEIYNEHVPSITTHEDNEEDQDRPLSPHVFLGWKYIYMDSEVISGTRFKNIYIKDEEWGENASGNIHIIQSNSAGTSNFEQLFPLYVELELIEGIPLLYKRKYSKNGTDPTNSVVYELAWWDGLREYITSRDFQINLDSVSTGKNLSRNVSNRNFELEDVTVVSYVDQNLAHNFPIEVEAGQIDLVENNKIYLVLSLDSIFSDYNISAFNNVDVTWDNVDDPDFTPSALFNLLNMEYIRDEEPQQSQLTQDGNSYYRWDYNDTVIEKAPDISLEDGVVYIGSQSELGQKELISGFEKVEINNFVYWTLPEYAIVESLVTSEDLETFQRDFPNQLIWSEPYIIGSDISGIRDFTFTNFKNISQEYGRILDIHYIHNVLLVFCERGVNLINVGEIITEQPSGQTVIDSAQFLTGDRWILTNVPNIQSKSIVQYEDILFFSDGRDIWMFSEGLKNISNGRIEIGGIASPFCISCASIDPKNKEYRISDTEQTWTYSIELDEWMGPHQYRDTTSATYRDRMFSVVGDKLVEHNKGNTFNGSLYDSVIESIALPQEAKSLDKLYRKFYIESGDGEFSYSKDYNNWTDSDLTTTIQKGNLKHIGINRESQNSNRIYWRLKSNEEGFILRSVDFEWHPRNRR